MPDALAVLTTCWGLVMGLAPLLQVRVIVRERSAAGVSLTWVWIMLIGFVLWLSYGVVNNDLPIIIANCVSIATAVVLLATAALYRRAPQPAIAGPDSGAAQADLAASSSPVEAR